MAPQDAHEVLGTLVRDLTTSLNALKGEPTWSEMRQALHDDKKLPEKGIFTQSSEAINLLHQIGQLLEPAHLVLADHFLGTQHTSRSLLYVCAFNSCSLTNLS